jgi:1-aminocyclopropane-1-carboxylate deaminase
MSLGTLDSISAFFGAQPELKIQSLKNYPDAFKQLKHVEFDVLRDDLMHPVLSGNKFRKLKYTLLNAPKDAVFLTFGGPYSNHLYAIAEAVNLFDLKAHTLWRKTKDSTTPTLAFAQNMGVHLHALSPADYKKRYDKHAIQQWMREFGATHFIPEGGANVEGIRGCSEILAHPKLDLASYEVVATACGTGCTLAGLIRYLAIHRPSITLIGISALKHVAHIQQFIDQHLTEAERHWASKKLLLLPETRFKGYAQYTNELLQFMRFMYQENALELDHVYTAKLVWHLFDYFLTPERANILNKVLIIHTGGLQGKAGLYSTLPVK